MIKGQFLGREVLTAIMTNPFTDLSLPPVLLPHGAGFFSLSTDTCIINFEFNSHQLSTLCYILGRVIIAQFSDLCDLAKLL